MVKQGGMSSAYPPPGARESTEEEEADPGVPFEHGMVQPGRKPPPQAWFQRQNMQGWMNRMAKPPAVPVHHAMPGPPPAGPPPHGMAGSLPTGPPPSGAGQGGLSSVNPPPGAGAAPKPMAEGYCRPTHKYGRYQAPAEAEGDPSSRPTWTWTSWKSRYGHWWADRCSRRRPDDFGRIYVDGSRTYGGHPNWSWRSTW